MQITDTLGHNWTNTDKSYFTKYSIKIEIDQESEMEQRKLIKYEWQCQMYEEIMIYYEHN